MTTAKEYIQSTFETVKARNGHEIAFAIMNQNALSGREARAFQDAVCDEVIR